MISNARLIQMLRALGDAQDLRAGRLPERIKRRLDWTPRLQVIGAWIAGAERRRLYAIGQWLGREVAP